MATRKTAAKKATTRQPRAAKAARRSNGAQLPEGFEPISGSFAQKWDYESQPVIEGTVVRKDSIDVGKGRNKRAADVMEIELDDGTKLAVWKSAALQGFFDEAQVGDEVALAYQGEQTVPGQKNPMHVIQAGIKGGRKAPAKAAGRGRGARA